MRRSLVLAVVALALAGALPARAADPFPASIGLPDGFAPEGIAIAGQTFFTGSLVDGDIYKGDLQTGSGDRLVDGREGRIAVGMKFDRGLLYVAGGETGDAYVYDASTGADVESYSFEGAGFVNDVVVTKEAAWFTDSAVQVLYKVPLAPNGTPGSQADVETIPLTGDIVFQDGFNVNGIDATPDGTTLVIVQSNTGRLFTVDASTGETAEIDLGDDDVVNGDGILLDGRTLFVVQNFFNQVAEVSLSPDLSSGAVQSLTTSENFDVPTTVAEFGSRLYLPNARFTTPVTPTTTYSITQIRKP